MTHDPLCPNGEMTWLPETAICLTCHVIKNTRKDERAAALRDAVEAVDSEKTEDPSWDGTNWNNALFVAQEAIESIGSKQ